MAADFPFVYPYSFEEAARLNQTTLWAVSHTENISCKRAIEEAVAKDHDGKHLQPDCANSVIEEFGFERVQWVLSATIQQKESDGRFSHNNKEWAQLIYVPPSDSHMNERILVNSHPAILDGFTNQFRKERQKLGLFDISHCEPDSKSLDYEDKVLVLSPSVISERHWKPENQLWLAKYGGGCMPEKVDRTIRAICLADGEEARWRRYEFVGAIKDSCLPDWARQAVEKIKEHSHIDLTPPSVGGMEMT